MEKQFMDWDFENDLWNQANYTQKYVAPSPSVHARKGRASLYDDDADDYVGTLLKSKPTVKMIRGRPLKIEEDTRPGIVNQHEVTQSIREMTNGTRHLNVSLENYVMHSKKIRNIEPSTASIMPNLGFKMTTKKISDKLQEDCKRSSSNYVTASSGSTSPSSASTSSKFKECKSSP